MRVGARMKAKVEVVYEIREERACRVRVRVRVSSFGRVTKFWLDCLFSAHVYECPLCKFLIEWNHEFL